MDPQEFSSLRTRFALGGTSRWWIAVALAVIFSLHLPPLFAAKRPRPVKPNASSLIWGNHEVRNDRILARLQTGHDQKAIERIESTLRAKGFLVARRYIQPERLWLLSFDPVKPGPLASHLKYLQESGWFEYVEPDPMVWASAAPADTAFGDGTLWGLRNSGQSGGVSGADINAERAWDITTGSPVVVAVIDTGIRHTHQDLSSNMWRNPGESGGGRESNGVDDDGNGYVDDVHGINAITGTGDPMDDNDHGTHCAGTIGASANDDGPHVGVAWNVRLMGAKFLSADGSGSTSDAIACIEYAVDHGARILSNSWGGGGSSAALSDSIAAARDKGVLFIAAAGNDGSDIDSDPQYPASYELDNVVAVAALTRHDTVAGFSNIGARRVHLGAPGEEIYSCSAGSDSAYNTFDGTSMATPHVAGAAALLLTAFPTATPLELRQRLIVGSRSLSALLGKSVGGALDAHSALTIQADGILELRISSSRTPLPAGGRAGIFVSVTDLAPIVSANVGIRLGTEPALTLQDEGVSPDQRAGDGVYSGTIDVPTGIASLEISATASTREAVPATTTVLFPVATPPVNDAFHDRLPLPVGTTRSTGSNLNASVEPDEPREPSGAGSQSVWWSWIAATDGTVTLSTAGSSFDTTLAVYTGSEFLALTLVGADDDTNGLQSAVTFAATAGTSYAIQVNGYGGAAGSIVLNHPPSGAVPGAPVIVENPLSASILLGQTFELRVAATGNPTLAYQWFLNGLPIEETIGPTYGQTSATLAHEGTYRVRVSNDEGVALSTDVYVAVEQTAIIPENDAFASAIALAGAAGTARGSSRLATGEPGEPNHANASVPLHSLWWKWTAPDNGRLTVDTFGSAFDTTLAVYTGPTPGELTAVASNDNSSAIQQSAVVLDVTSGVTYALAVDGNGAAVGQVRLNFSFQPVSPGPVNDSFGNRLALVSDALTTGSNVGATGEPGEPEFPIGAPPLSSVWWSWTTPESGRVEITTDGSDFDTTLAIYRGNTLGTLELVAENDDDNGLQSGVTLNVSERETLQIVVDGYGQAEGSIVLQARFASSVVPNDDFSQAAAIGEDVSRVTGSNRGATGEPGEPGHYSDASFPIQSIWWRWVAPAAGTLTVDLSESDFDTLLAVYRGNALGSLTAVASDDDGGDGLASRVSMPVIAGQTYHIAVDGYGSATGSIVATLAFGPLGQGLSLAEALDSSLPWTTGGSAPWFGVNEPSHDGMDAARGGEIADLASSWIQTTVVGPGTLEFWWRIDSEEFFDVLTVTRNNASEKEISGLTFWERCTLAVPAGTHIMRWTYAKDASVSDGLDTAWLDQVAFFPEAYTAWMARHPSIPDGQRGFQDDPDADGETNVLEYYFNSAPDKNHWPSESAPVVAADETTLSFTYLRNKNSQGVVGTVQWSPDMRNWGSSGTLIGDTRLTLSETVDTSPTHHDRVTVNGVVVEGAPRHVFFRIVVRY